MTPWKSIFAGALQGKGKMRGVSTVSCGGSSGVVPAAVSCSRARRQSTTPRNCGRFNLQMAPNELIKFTPPPRKEGNGRTGSDVDEAWEDLLAIGASQKVQQALGRLLSCKSLAGSLGRHRPCRS